MSYQGGKQIAMSSSNLYVEWRRLLPVLVLGGLALICLRAVAIDRRFSELVEGVGYVVADTMFATFVVLTFKKDKSPKTERPVPSQGLRPAQFWSIKLMASVTNILLTLLLADLVIVSALGKAFGDYPWKYMTLTLSQMACAALCFGMFLSSKTKTLVAIVGTVVAPAVALLIALTVQLVLWKLGGVTFGGWVGRHPDLYLFLVTVPWAITALYLGWRRRMTMYGYNSIGIT